MPVFLSLLVCFGANSCHIEVPAVRPVFGIAACQIEGMQQAAHWKELHPDGEIRAIRCSVGNRPHADTDA